MKYIKYIFGITLLMGSMFIMIENVDALEGDGTETNPFIIQSCLDLQSMKDNLNAYYVLESDIDCSETVHWNNGIGFEPIGQCAVGQDFRGKLDGKGYKIKDLFINRPNLDCSALFGAVKDSSIKNIGIEDIRIIGGSAVGGLGGSIGTSTIENVEISGSIEGLNFVAGLIGSSSSNSINQVTTHAAIKGKVYVGGLNGYSSQNVIQEASMIGTVTSEQFASGFIGYSYKDKVAHSSVSADVSGNAYIGGLIGYGEYTEIKNSLTKGSVLAVDFTGGLIGAVAFGNIQNSFSEMNVTGTNRQGGLVGMLFQSSKVINSYANGDVKGSWRTGGLVGDINTSGSVDKSYSIGKVIGTNEAGGLVGRVTTNLITLSYYDKETSGKTETVRGTPKTTGEMKTQGTYSGWDFNSVWGIDGSGIINKGYPFLKVAPGTINNIKEFHVSKSVELSWDNPSDQDFDHVIIFRDNNIVGNTSGESFIDSNLSPETTYVYTLVAVDKFGNKSVEKEIEVTTLDGLFHLFAPSIGDFQSILISEDEQIVRTSFLNPLKIIDSTGEDKNWSLTVEATPFKEIGGKEYQLSNHLLILKAPSLINITKGMPENPMISEGESWTINGGQSVKIADMKSNRVVNEYEIIFPENALEFHLSPDGAYADTEHYPMGTPYESTLTFTITVGP